MVIGVVQLTQANGQNNKHKKSLAYLYGGACMVTLALLFLFTKVMPTGHT